MKKDIIISMIVKFGQIGLSFLGGIIIARILFSEGKGEIVSYLAPYGLVMSLTNFGITTSSAYFYSKEKWRIEIIAIIHSVMFIFGSILTIFILLFSLYYQNLFNNKMIIIILVLILFLQRFISYTSSIALSKRWISKILYQEAVEVVVNFLLLIIFFLFLKKTFEWFFIAMLISKILSLPIIFSWLTKVENYRFNLNIKEFKKVFRKFFKKSITYAIPLFVFGLNYKADIIILEHYVSKSEIGFYSIGVSLSLLIWIIPDVMKRIILSYSVGTKKTDEKNFSRNLWKNTIKLMILIIPFVVIGYFLSDYIIPFVYGKTFYASVLPFKILLLGTYFMSLFKMLNGDLAAQGKPHIALIIFSITAFLNIIGNLIFAPYYGILAAAWTTTITYFIGSVIFVISYYYIAVKE